MAINLVLENDEFNFVVGLVGKEPFNNVAGLMGKLIQQAQAQQMAQTPVAPPAPATPPAPGDQAGLTEQNVQ